jgi:hypothetical protein
MPFVFMSGAVNDREFHGHASRTIQFVGPKTEYTHMRNGGPDARWEHVARREWWRHGVNRVLATMRIQWRFRVTEIPPIAVPMGNVLLTFAPYTDTRYRGLSMARLIDFDTALGAGWSVRQSNSESNGST